MPTSVPSRNTKEQTVSGLRDERPNERRILGNRLEEVEEDLKDEFMSLWQRCSRYEFEMLGREEHSSGFQYWIDQEYKNGNPLAVAHHNIEAEIEDFKLETGPS